MYDKENHHPSASVYQKKKKKRKENCSIMDFNYTLKDYYGIKYIQLMGKCLCKAFGIRS